MTLKELRLSFGITQKEAALSVNVPLRTYIRYEKMNDSNNLKYRKIMELLIDNYQVNENKGVLTIDKIKQIISEVLSKHKDNIVFCYLFGSYAKGKANDSSDIDLCIDTNLKGFAFVGLIEELRQNLKKSVVK